MAVHNDAVLGFPIEVFHNKDSLLEALLRLIDEDLYRNRIIHLTNLPATRILSLVIDLL